MDLALPAEAEAFRADVRAWVEANLTPDLVHAGRDDVDGLRAWSRTLHDAGLATAAWPTEHGGRGADVFRQVVLAEEMARAGAPVHVNIIGLQNIAPAIMQWGTPAQQTRHLGPMATAENIWCQGFSEPGAGSDLASLATRAVRDGHHYVVNGQKVWTSLGHHADWCELLVRTRVDGPRHAGITCLLVDMHTPGIEARPLVTMGGSHDFAEMFFTDVRVPVADRLGPENEGWKVAMTTLSHERAGVANLYLMVRGHLDRVIAEAVDAGATADPLVRVRLASLHEEARVLEWLAKRSISAATPGPEGSVIKLLWSEVEQRITETASDVLGMAALDGPWAADLLAARSHTIAGGTSQVNRNIVAERVLGLPRG